LGAWNFDIDQSVSARPDPVMYGDAMTGTDLAERCMWEIAELHRFFEAWFNGEPAELARFEGVLDPAFQLIAPDGVAFGRAEIIDRVRRGRGSATEHRMRIGIERCRPRLVAPPWALLTYEEHQETQEGSRARISSALFRDDAAGLRWVHVHETWCPQPSPEPEPAGG
jgi:hypothetical protein